MQIYLKQTNKLLNSYFRLVDSLANRNATFEIRKFIR